MKLSREAREMCGRSTHLRPKTGRLARTIFLIAVAIAVVALPAQALNINVTYDSSVPAVAQTAFNGVIATYDSMFSNTATVNINVQFGNTGLGSSSTFFITNLTYSQWRAALAADSAAHPDNAILAAALASLPASNPLGASTADVLVATADAKALGLAVSQNPDSTITLSNSVTFEYTGVATPGAFDAIGVFEHELDEALGIGSALTGIADNGALPTTFEAEDYFRYSSLNTRAVTTDPNASVFFSYNSGNTLVAQFNQMNTVQGASPIDRNDWIYGNVSCPAIAFVQDALTCANSVPASPFAPGSPEALVLEALGYDLSVPEPGSMFLAGAAIVGFALLRWRQIRHKHARE